MQSIESFSRQFDEIRQRTRELRSGRKELDEQVLAEAIQELQVAFEELQVAEEELRQQADQISLVNESMLVERNRYLELFDMAPDGYLVTDPRGIIIEANQAAAMMLDVRQEYLIGKPMVSYLSLDSRTMFRCELNALMTADLQQEMEVVMQPRTGPIFDAALKVNVIRNRDGSAVALRWTMRDVTPRNRAADEIRRLNLELEGKIARRTEQLSAANSELQKLLETERELRRVAEQAIADRESEAIERQRAEASLRASEERFRALVENSWDAIALIQADGTLLYTTPAITHILGVTPSVAVQYNLFEFVHPQDMSQVAAMLDRLLLAPHLPVGGECRHRHADGSWRWLDVTARNMTGHPAVGAIVINYRDISQQKESEQRRSELLEAERKARSEAESAIRSRDRFIAMVSHEIRSPLMPILAVMEELELENLPERLRPELEIVLRNSRHAAALINDLLDTARIERESMAVEIELIDLHTILRQIVEGYASEARSKELSIEIALKAERHHVEGDPQRLEQVFRNLMNNAMKFTPAGGSISLETGNRDGRIEIDCIDSGIGIDPVKLQQIFEPFHKGSSESGRKAGLGLGLAICRKIVDLHGGSIEAESAGPGRGARFRVSLAAAEAEAR